MAASQNSPSAQQNTGSKDRPWIPRFWDGMTVWAWLLILIRNRFAMSLSRVPMVLIISLISFANSLLWLVQMILLGHKIARTPIQDDPIFVIGHWRSGTTMLHELLVLDKRHSYADTYQCFAPDHFLVSGWFLRPLVRFLLPARRPMDNMAAGWDRPQEDEFALCNMGGRSPYLTIAFPNRPPQDQEYFELEQVSPEARSLWKQHMLWFVKSLTMHCSRRIVLKSPPHTFRVKVLLELFPNARFIHIVRNPFEIYPSTINLWKRLYRDQGLQVPNYEGLQEFVLETFNRMFEVFRAATRPDPAARLCEVRYEDLVKDPLAEMRAIYEQLQLGGFDEVLPAFKQYFADRADYKTNRFQLSPQDRAEIARRWRPYMEHYGYGEQAEIAPATV